MSLRMPIRAKVFIAITAAAGALVLATALPHWHAHDLPKFLCYFLIAALSSTMKVRLPGVEGTMSVYFLFVLLGVLQLSLPQTLMIGCAVALIQTFWKPLHKPEPVKAVFNIGMNSNAICLTYFAYHLSVTPLHNSAPLLLLVAISTYFLTNTLPVAAAIALTENKSIRGVWAETYFWSFPYYLAGAAVVGVVSFIERYLGWQGAILVLPVMYVFYRSYHLYLGRLEEEKRRVETEKERVAAEKRHVEDEKRHAQQISALHLRTIEALALAIDAKDHTTHEHLHRVRTYAIEIATEMGLDKKELDALRAAALLHDIGKLAVPDHIISKPGRLTAEEFDKMKIHPVVGAEILETVAFPYPVAPIVRSHHEKWNGTGYPDGLKGENIPIGARILSAVDCLDAIATDRQYRKALPLDEAMKAVTAQAGTSFDPRVVAILQRRHVELENLARRTLRLTERGRISHDCKVRRGDGPASGLENSVSEGRLESDFLSSIASARQEAQALFELSQGLGNSLSLDETLSLVSVRLRKLVPYDSIVTFVRKGDLLVPAFVGGDNFRLLSSLQIVVGEGLSGWVAQHAKPIINGNPAVETGYVEDSTRDVELRSALAVPLDGVNGLVGVLTLYRTAANAFNGDNLRVLQVITSKVALSVANALKYSQAETSAISDYLTGLPNARALFVQLERELQRCERESSTTAVLVCDLDGFKQINDRYGHLDGDKTLKIFAKLLAAAFRPYDIVARMGGDEFVIIATNMSADAVTKKTTLLEAIAQQAGRQVCGLDLLSLSVGAAFYPQDGSDAEQLLAEADRKMYAAKQLHHATPRETPA